MTESEFIAELKLLVGDIAKDWTTKQLYTYIAYYYTSHREAQARAQSNDPAQQDRGLESLFQTFGTTETVLAAFLIQLLARYSKDIVAELLDFFKTQQQESRQNEQKKIPS